MKAWDPIQVAAGQKAPMVAKVLRAAARRAAREGVRTYSRAAVNAMMPYTKRPVVQMNENATAVNHMMIPMMPPMATVLAAIGIAMMVAAKIRKMVSASSSSCLKMVDNELIAPVSDEKPLWTQCWSWCTLSETQEVLGDTAGALAPM